MAEGEINIDNIIQRLLEGNFILKMVVKFISEVILCKSSEFSTLFNSLEYY